MSLRSFFKVATAAGFALLIFAGTGAAASRPSPAATRVTIQTWPKGLFGYVSSPRHARCAAGRWVAVFVQRGGRPNPQRDRRIARVRARGKRYAYQWSIKTNRRARLYARVGSKQGCRVTNSRGVVQAFSNPAEGQASGYPECSPYVAEDLSTICHFGQMHLVIHGATVFEGCTIGDSDACEGDAKSGPYPWGRRGQGGLGPSSNDREVKLAWNWGPGTRNATVLFTAYNAGSNIGIAHLGGTLPAPNSAAFRVDDGFAVNDDLGYPNGEHFFTPDIPGQAPGEVGGALHFDFVNGNPANVYIEGYLFLK